MLSTYACTSISVIAGGVSSGGGNWENRICVAVLLVCFIHEIRVQKNANRTCVGAENMHDNLYELGVHNGLFWSV